MSEPKSLITVEPRDIVGRVRQQYLADPEKTTESFRIAVDVASAAYEQQIAKQLTPSEQKRLQEALAKGKETAVAIISTLDEILSDSTQLQPASFEAQVLYGFTATIGAGVRLNPRLITDEVAQLVISNALNLVGDIADVTTTRYFLGRNAEGNANELVGQYFTAVPFTPSYEELRASGRPVGLILDDWAGAVRYCRTMGVPEEAFLRDGANLFRFAPDTLGYVQQNLDSFPGLDLLKVNNGRHVESWLTSATIGVGNDVVNQDNWLVLLTGYGPEDNATVPGLLQRYSTPLLSTALDLENRRL